jgi:hypothetical protein
MSRKIVIISTDNSPLYAGFEPLVTWCWNQLGWDVICLNANKIKASDKRLKDYDSGLISQVSRLYASQLPQVNKADYLMTSDIDMIPLKDFNTYFKYNPNDITSFGRDLTDYHYPICYIGMTAQKWSEVMNLGGCTFNEGLHRDLNLFKNHWTTDQDIITERLKDYEVKVIPRGNGSNAMALGRLDRYNMIQPSECRIDFHSLRPLAEYKHEVVSIVANEYNQTFETVSKLL